MSSNSSHLVGGLDYWERQREQAPDFEILFGADGLVPHSYRLLAEGRPVTLDRLAAAMSRPVAEVEAALRRQPGTDWDEQGRLVGFGLSLRPTQHRFTFDGGPTLYTWCASDALTVPVLVGRPGVVESTCAVTAQPITVRITPERVVEVDPPSAVVTLVRPERVDDIRGDVCGLGTFVAAEDAAAEWLAVHPEGMVHSVEEDFQTHREVALHLGWPAADDENCCDIPTGAARDARSGVPARVAFAAIRRGDRIGPDEIARRAGITAEAADADLRMLVDAGEANRDEEGRVVAIAGLSLVPAAHGLLLDGVELHTWCAYDAIGIPAALGVDARAQTRCRWCGRPVEVELSRGRIVGEPAARLWFPTAPLGGDEGGNPQLVWCPQANLFCDEDHLDRWRQAQDDPVGEGVTLAEAARRGAEHWAEFREPVA